MMTNLYSKDAATDPAQGGRCSRSNSLNASSLHSSTFSLPAWGVGFWQLYGDDYCCNLRRDLEKLKDEKYDGDEERFAAGWVRPTLDLLKRLQEQGFPVRTREYVVVHLSMPVNAMAAGEMCLQVGRQHPGTLTVKFTKRNGSTSNEYTIGPRVLSLAEEAAFASDPMNFLGHFREELKVPGTDSSELMQSLIVSPDGCRLERFAVGQFFRNAATNDSKKQISFFPPPAMASHPVQYPYMPFTCGGVPVMPFYGGSFPVPHSMPHYPPMVAQDYQSVAHQINPVSNGPFLNGPSCSIVSNRSPTEIRRTSGSNTPGVGFGNHMHQSAHQRAVEPQMVRERSVASIEGLLAPTELPVYLRRGSCPASANGVKEETPYPNYTPRNPSPNVRHSEPVEDDETSEIQQQIQNVTLQNRVPQHEDCTCEQPKKIDLPGRRPSITASIHVHYPVTQSEQNNLSQSPYSESRSLGSGGSSNGMMAEVKATFVSPTKPALLVMTGKANAVKKTVVIDEYMGSPETAPESNYKMYNTTNSMGKIPPKTSTEDEYFGKNVETTKNVAPLTAPRQEISNSQKFLKTPVTDEYFYGDEKISNLQGNKTPSSGTVTANSWESHVPPQEVRAQPIAPRYDSTTGMPVDSGEFIQEHLQRFLSEACRDLENYQRNQPCVAGLLPPTSDDNAFNSGVSWGSHREGSLPITLQEFGRLSS